MWRKADKSSVGSLVCCTKSQKRETDKKYVSPNKISSHFGQKKGNFKIKSSEHLSAMTLAKVIV